LHSCREQRFLNGVLGCGEVMETANDRSQNLGRELAQQVIERRN
jgi:hypothetical protein